MTELERKIRFDAALEMVQHVYHDYCRDESKTREQAGKFCDFVIDMIKFSEVLKNEVEKPTLDNQIGSAADRLPLQREEEHTSPPPQTKEQR